MTKNNKKGDAWAPAEADWYKDAILYEVRVRSFYDSNNDGIGDFQGLTEKLDYLQDLGVTALWLLPFYPSPLRDDGYDIADYNNVHPDCGTLRDFKIFLREAHRRGLRVITELVLNHTSDQHPWFQRARRAPAGSRYRNFYVWSDDPKKYSGTRIIFQDFETSNWAWDPVAKQYYWHRFYSHQPDLNFDNPEVRRATFRIMDFWFGMGVDGMRLDAVPYFYEREGTSNENLPETHQYLKELRRYLDQKYRNRMLLAEANQWPEDAVAYFAQGDECHMAFHFPLMPRLFMAIRMENRFPIIDIWAQTPPIPENCQWALFLRNHDELTLEMVTEEERDYMYRAYAHDQQMRINLGIRRRLAPLMGNDRRKIELMNALLFSLPGTPIIYYGDEIGMGDNVFLGDRNGVRTPMQWNADRNAGFSRANPQRLILPVIIDHEYHYQTVNVEAQQANPHSLLWWTKRLIVLRKQFKAFGRGTMEFLDPENSHVLAFVRSYQEERILVVANLSRFVQYLELDLSRFKGMQPVELFGRVAFPPIGDLPYFLTLGPHAFAWFALERPRTSLGELRTGPRELPRLAVDGPWERLVVGAARGSLEQVLVEHLPRWRWFRSKSREIRAVRVEEAIAVHENSKKFYVALITVQYRDDEPETYVLPLSFLSGDRAVEIRVRSPQAIIAEVQARESSNGRAAPLHGLLIDATFDPEFERLLLNAITRHRRLRGNNGEVVPGVAQVARSLRIDEIGEPRVLKGEQTNSSIVFGDRFILKLCRRLDEGLSPELEITRFLTERTHFQNVPPTVGWLNYQQAQSEPRTLAILQTFVPNQGDAWQFTLDELHRYYERIVIEHRNAIEYPPRTMREIVEESVSDAGDELIGVYLDAAELLGKRTAELHVALASDSEDPAFAPEPLTSLYQRSVYQSMRNLATNTFRQLRAAMRTLSPEFQEEAAKLLAKQEQITAIFDAFLKQPPTGVRMRCHGDYHLGQVLSTGKDFVIIDFEGEPARTLSDRRRKRSPLRDVAGMLRSFHYAALSALHEALGTGRLGEHTFDQMEPWARRWQIEVSRTFLRSYLNTVQETEIVPRDRENLAAALEAYVTEKAVYELGYELNNRPEWLWLPLKGVRDILAAHGKWR